jgi:hypothetical protein
MDKIYPRLHQFEWVSHENTVLIKIIIRHLKREGCLEKCHFLQHCDGQRRHDGFGKPLVTRLFPVYRLMTARIFIFYSLYWYTKDDSKESRNVRLSDFVISRWINNYMKINFDCAPIPALTLISLILNCVFISHERCENHLNSHVLRFTRNISNTLLILHNNEYTRKLIFSTIKQRLKKIFYRPVSIIV